MRAPGARQPTASSASMSKESRTALGSRSEHNRMRLLQEHLPLPIMHKKADSTTSSYCIFQKAPKGESGPREFGEIVCVDDVPEQTTLASRTDEDLGAEGWVPMESTEYNIRSLAAIRQASDKLEECIGSLARQYVSDPKSRSTEDSNRNPLIVCSIQRAEAYHYLLLTYTLTAAHNERGSRTLARFQNGEADATEAQEQQAESLASTFLELDQRVSRSKFGKVSALFDRGAQLRGRLLNPTDRFQYDDMAREPLRKMVHLLEARRSLDSFRKLSSVLDKGERASDADSSLQIDDEQAKRAFANWTLGRYYHEPRSKSFMLQSRGSVAASESQDSSSTPARRGIDATVPSEVLEAWGKGYTVDSSGRSHLPVKALVALQNFDRFKDHHQTVLPEASSSPPVIPWAPERPHDTANAPGLITMDQGPLTQTSTPETVALGASNQDTPRSLKQLMKEVGVGRKRGKQGRSHRFPSHPETHHWENDSGNVDHQESTASSMADASRRDPGASQAGCPSPSVNRSSTLPSRTHGREYEAASRLEPAMGPTSNPSGATHSNQPPSSKPPSKTKKRKNRKPRFRQRPIAPVRMPNLARCNASTEETQDPVTVHGLPSNSDALDPEGRLDACPWPERNIRLCELNEYFDDEDYMSDVDHRLAAVQPPLTRSDLKPSGSKSMIASARPMQRGRFTTESFYGDNGRTSEQHARDDSEKWPILVREQDAATWMMVKDWLLAHGPTDGNIGEQHNLNKSICADSIRDIRRTAWCASAAAFLEGDCRANREQTANKCIPNARRVAMQISNEDSVSGMYLRS